MSILEKVDNFRQELDELVLDLPTVAAKTLGLDRRCGHNIAIADDCIIVPLNDDSNLQYYGGAEYWDKDGRIVMGDYVIYTNEISHVESLIKRYNEQRGEGASDE